MRLTIIAVALALASSPVLAQNFNANANTTTNNVNSTSNAGSYSNSTAGSVSSSQNAGNQQNINFNSSAPDSHTRVDTTPSLGVAPSAFGFSQNNCGGSDSVGIGWTGFVAGGSKAREMFDCNVRADTIILWQLGLQNAARLRMVCFGSDLTRKAYEAAGGMCPKSATAEGIPGAPVTQSVAAAAPQSAPAPMPVTQSPVQPAGQRSVAPAQAAQPAIQTPQPVTQAISTPAQGASHGRINQDGSVTWTQ